MSSYILIIINQLVHHPSDGSMESFKAKTMHGDTFCGKHEGEQTVSGMKVTLENKIFAQR